MTGANDCPYCGANNAAWDAARAAAWAAERNWQKGRLRRMCRTEDNR
jgi:hypothetical protein